MISSQFINIKYCFDYLIDQIPVGLLLYSHIPTALLSLLFSSYVFFKIKNKSSAILFIVCLFFTGWCIFDLVSWFAFLGSKSVMFSWSILDLFGLLFFFFSYYFLYVFITERDMPNWQKILGTLIFLPTAIWTFLGSNLSFYDANICESVENNAVTIYPYFAEFLYILATIFLTITEYKNEKDISRKKTILFVGLGVILFLFFFFSSTFLVNILVNNDTLLEYAYNYEIYGLFGMPLLLVFLGYLVVRYKAFNVKIFGAQALIISLIALTGSQFFFIQSNINRILTGIALLILCIVGINLIRSVKREVEQREKIEKLAKELGQANEKLKELDELKSEFLSLATHQLRAPLTAIKGYSSMLSEGDFGILPTKAKDAVSTISTSCQNLINIVEDFLNISRIEQGRMVYNKDVFDIKKLVEEVIKEIKPNTDKAGIQIKITAPENINAKVEADISKSKQIINNIIDNAIKYTIKGSVQISIKIEKNKHNQNIAKIAIQDSGIGIDPSEINKLFNKFSRAKDANKTNINGTGLGLYIAKKMAEAQGGDIKVFSEGLGKGSTFTIELPVFE